jgi:hypothetical protein
MSLSRPLLARVCDACEHHAGAYSLLFLTPDKLFAVRDPYGFRPLVGPEPERRRRLRVRDLRAGPHRRHLRARGGAWGGGHGRPPRHVGGLGLPRPAPPLQVSRWPSPSASWQTW